MNHNTRILNIRIRLCGVVVIPSDFEYSVLQKFRQPRFEPGHDLSAFVCFFFSLPTRKVGWAGIYIYIDGGFLAVNRKI